MKQRVLKVGDCVMFTSESARRVGELILKQENFYINASRGARVDKRTFGFIKEVRTLEVKGVCNIVRKYNVCLVKFDDVVGWTDAIFLEQARISA